MDENPGEDRRDDINKHKMGEMIKIKVNLLGGDDNNRQEELERLNLETLVCLSMVKTQADLLKAQKLEEHAEKRRKAREEEQVIITPGSEERSERNAAELIAQEEREKLAKQEKQKKMEERKKARMMKNNTSSSHVEDGAVENEPEAARDMQVPVEKVRGNHESQEKQKSVDKQKSIDEEKQRNEKKQEIAEKQANAKRKIAENQKNEEKKKTAEKQKNAETQNISQKQNIAGKQKTAKEQKNTKKQDNNISKRNGCGGSVPVQQEKQKNSNQKEASKKKQLSTKENLPEKKELPNKKGHPTKKEDTSRVTDSCYVNTGARPKVPRESSTKPDTGGKAHTTRGINLKNKKVAAEYLLSRNDQRNSAQKLELTGPGSGKLNKTESATFNEIYYINLEVDSHLVGGSENYYHRGNEAVAGNSQSTGHVQKHSAESEPLQQKTTGEETTSLISEHYMLQTNANQWQRNEKSGYEQEISAQAKASVYQQAFIDPKYHTAPQAGYIQYTTNIHHVLQQTRPREESLTPAQAGTGKPHSTFSRAVGSERPTFSRAVGSERKKFSSVVGSGCETFLQARGTFSRAVGSERRLMSRLAETDHTCFRLATKLDWHTLPLEIDVECLNCLRSRVSNHLMASQTSPELYQDFVLPANTDQTFTQVPMTEQQVSSPASTPELRRSTPENASELFRLTRLTPANTHESTPANTPELYRSTPENTPELYQSAPANSAQTHRSTPANTVKPHWSTPPITVESHRSTPANTVKPHWSTPPITVKSHRSMPPNTVKSHRSAPQVEYKASSQANSSQPTPTLPKTASVGQQVSAAASGTTSPQTKRPDDQPKSKEFSSHPWNLRPPIFMPPRLVSSFNPEGYTTVWVGNLAPGTTEAQLAEIFAKVGKIMTVKIIPGKPYAFITFDDKVSTVLAIRKFHGFKLNGRNLRVDFPLNPKNTSHDSEKTSANSKGTEKKKRTHGG